MSKYPVIIGRAEYIDIIDMSLDVPAKIDTGAFRSAIHASNIRIKKVAGKEVLTCDLLGHKCAPIKRKFEADEFSKVSITNSFGKEEPRYEVSIKVKMGPKIFHTSFTLADRSSNLFPVLVGRKMLKNRYFVDVSKASVNRIKLKKEFGIKTPIDAEDLED
ncbi:MAG: RimK/LysX family protein [Candidatus Saccharimonadales bacterium]